MSVESARARRCASAPCLHRRVNPSRAGRPEAWGGELSVRRTFICVLVVSLGLLLLAAPAVLATPPTVTGLSSPTHPSASTWYRNNTPAFRWSPAQATDQAIDGYSYVLDQNPDTVPDTTIELRSLTLATSTDLSVGADPRSVILADVNADSILDIVTANYWDNTVSVLVGDQGETFRPKADFSLLPDEGPTGVAAGDFNGDGKLDLVTSNELTTNVCILLGNGTGGFTLHSNQITGNTPSAVGVADFNGDGKLDVVTANRDKQDPDDLFCTISVLLGNGDGTLKARVDYYGAPYPDSLVLGDFTGDGKLDVATGNEASSVTVYQGRGDGTFAADTPTTPVGHQVDGIAAGDFNGDGRLDVVTAESGADQISVLLNQGTSLFAAPVHHAAGDGTCGVAVGDVNDDGRPDIAAAAFNSRDVTVLLGSGDGSFSSADGTYGCPAMPRGVSVADLDRDGVDDVVVSTNVDIDEPGYVSILAGIGDGALLARRDYDVGTVGAYNQHIWVASADLNDDGKDDLGAADAVGWKIFPMLSGADGFTILPSVGTPSQPDDIVAADFNNDGKQDLATANVGNYSVSVALGNGAGGLAAVIDTGTFGIGPSLLAADDFDQDGKADLAVTSHGSHWVELLGGDGTGRFPNWIAWQTGTSFSSVLSGDFDGDDIPDVALAGQGNISQSVNFIVSSEAWTLYSGVVPLDCVGSRLASGDFDRDGMLDLVTTAPISTSHATVRLFRGNNDLTFAEIWSAVSVDGLGFIPAVADMNGDGCLDLVLADDQASPDNLSVLLGNGDGTFSRWQRWTTGTFSASVAVGDYDGDGWPDVATGRNEASVSVLLNAGASSKAGFPAKADGTWYFHLRAVDAAGVGGPTSTLAVKMDATAPTPSDNADAVWHQGGFTLNLSGTDAASGVARITVNRDGRVFSVSAASLSLAFETWKRGGGSGMHTVAYRVTDRAGNASSLVTRTVKVDGKPPQTAADAPRDSLGAPVPQSQALTVHLTATDQVALSGVKETWWSLDGGNWTKGTSVAVPAVNGYHFIRSYSIDNAGNRESTETCTVRMVISGSAAKANAPRRGLALWRRWAMSA